MSEQSKITPGEWYVDEIGMMVWAKNPYGLGDMLIANIRGHGHLTGKGACSMTDNAAEEIQLANAHMLAASKDLFEALELMLEASRPEISPIDGKVELMPSQKRIELCIKATKKAESAIAKARGDQ